MAILHPQECYLLEQYTSPEHFAATRDAIIEFIDGHEAAYARYQQELPVHTRSEPLWRQADAVWGGRVLPNIRPARDRYMKAYILRTHNDPNAFRIGHAMTNFNKGIREFWSGWMSDEEQTRISNTQTKANKLDGVLSRTVSRGWSEGHLTYLHEKNNDLPKRIPRYALDSSVRIENGELAKVAGIYLPDVEYASAQFLYPNENQTATPQAYQGVVRSDWVDEDTGERDYSWEECRRIETGWTLIRRVEGEFIEVPPGGFFPKGTPEELYSWPQREKDYVILEGECITAWSGEVSETMAVQQ